MKLYFLLAFAMITFGSSCFCQTNTDRTNDYESIVAEFTATANDDFLFGNGRSTRIDEPENERDALKKGLSTISFSEGKLRIEDTQTLHCQLVNIKSIEYSAILFSHKKVNRIALYRPETDGKYYFRIYEL